MVIVNDNFFIFQSKQEMNNRGNKYQSHSSSDSKQTNDVTSSYRNACEKTEGRFFQLVSSRQTDNSQEDGSGAFQRNKAYFEELSNERRSTSERDEMEVKENVDVEEVSVNKCHFHCMYSLLCRHRCHGIPVCGRGVWQNGSERGKEMLRRGLYWPSAAILLYSCNINVLDYPCILADT